MPYIRDVLVDVITDVSVSESSTTTDHALEDGEQITDHVKSNPITINIKGIILDNSEQKVLKLRNYRDSGALINYNYMSTYPNMVIVEFSRDYSKAIKNGYAFTMTLKQIGLGKVKKLVAVEKSISKQIREVVNRGLQQVKKKGE